LLSIFPQHKEVPTRLNDLNEEDVCRVLDFKQRGEEIENYLEQTASKNWQPYEHTNTESIKKYNIPTIDYKKLQIREKRIGQGGFGEVYFATLNGEPVAVKKLKNQQLTKKRLEMFTNEMNIFVKLNHSNVVSFLGACVEPPNLAIVMEMMDMSLYDAIHIKSVS
jgi:hypothetical protein